ncbi:Neutral ceramidase B [Venturia nashicola]|nr:Neutral ceramidase B [Venturia nashicola]
MASNKDHVDIVDIELKEAEMNRNSLGRGDSFEAEIENGEQESSMNRTKWLACIALGLSYSTALQQHACTATIVKHIDAALGPTSYYNWMLSANNIANSIALPLSGGLSDIFGRKIFFIGGCMLSLTGVTVALAARNIPTMIAAMLLKGFGSGAQALGIAAIGELVPNKHRGTAQAALDLVTLPWTVFGAMIGNSMVKHYALSFRINFIIGIFLNLLTIAMIHFFYHPPRGSLPPGTSKAKALRELDWTGIALYSIGMVLLLMGIAFGGKTFPWKSAGVIVNIILGLLAFIGLGFWEWKGARNPFFAHEIFTGQSSRFPIVLGITFVAGMSSYAANAFWTQESQAMFFSDPDKIGLSSLPIGIGGAIGGFLGGMLLGKGHFFKANYMLLYGATIKIGADIMLTYVTPDTLTLALVAGFFAMFGMGIVLVGTIVIVQLSCQDSHIGLATLVLSSIRSMGGSVAVTIYSSIMQNTMKEEAGPKVGEAIAKMNVPRTSIGPLIKLLMGNREKDAAKLPGVTKAVMQAAGTAIKWAWSVAFK